MKELDKIKQRINKRKKRNGLNKEETAINKSSKWFNVITSIMTIYVLFMSFAIYAKKDQDATILNDVFNTNINFKKFNSTLNSLLNIRLVEDEKDPVYDQVVSNDVIYMGVGEDYYVSEGNVAISLDDGVVTYVNGKDENYTIIVEYDSGVRATYNNLNEVNVYVNDRVYKDDIIGSYDDKLEMIFIRNSKKISYEEVIALI